jgi:hypothetical protein
VVRQHITSRMLTNDGTRSASSSPLRDMIGAQDSAFSPQNLHRLAAALAVLATVCLLGVFLPAPANAQSQGATEYQVKAAYLAGFSKFVVWPNESQSDGDPDFTIGIVGEDPFGPALSEAFADSKIAGHKVKVAIEHVRWDQNLRNCQAIFLAQSERKHLRAILENLGDSSVLTVSDMANFSSEGGMIGFVFDVDRIRFEINLDAVTRSHMKISSKLLTLARSVKGHPTRYADRN